jgi:hypothetical protein
LVDADSNAVFVGGLVSALGLFAWAQLPALCGFMFSSTRAGAGNYRYSMALGAMFAAIGLASGMRTALARPRAVLLYLGMLVNLGFLAGIAIAPAWYGESCRWLYLEML